MVLSLSSMKYKYMYMHYGGANFLFKLNKCFVCKNLMLLKMNTTKFSASIELL